MGDILFSREERIPIAIEQELKRSYLDYAMSVIIGRALPDVRDGLKPVHRRILFAMCEQGSTAGKPYKKSARIVGDVMGKYHPHGDSRDLRRAGAHGAGLLDAPPARRRPGQLRLGRRRPRGGHALHRGAAGAPRRGDARRRHRQGDRRLAPNYDGSMQRADGAAGALPNLLVNGSSGIAVGMATNIPPHNLGEVIDASVRWSRNPRHHRRRAHAPSCRVPTSRPAGIIRGTAGHPPGVRDRPRLGADAGARPHRATPRRATAIDHRHRAPLPGEQGARWSSASPSWCATRTSTASPTCATSPTATASASSSSSSATPSPQVVLNQLFKLTAMQIDVRHHLPGDRRQPAPGADTAGRCSSTSSSTARKW